MDYAMSCTLIESFQVQVTARSHSWIVDEPAELDGDDLGPNPLELLIGALGSCICITVSHHAAQSGIPVERLAVDLKGYRDEAKTFHIDTTVRVRGELDDKALRRLAAYARACPVHKLLEHGAAIQIEVVQV